MPTVVIEWLSAIFIFFLLLGYFRWLNAIDRDRIVASQVPVSGIEASHRGASSPARVVGVNKLLTLRTTAILIMSSVSIFMSELWVGSVADYQSPPGRYGQELWHVIALLVIVPSATASAVVITDLVLGLWTRMQHTGAGEIPSPPVLRVKRIADIRNMVNLRLFVDRGVTPDP